MVRTSPLSPLAPNGIRYVNTHHEEAAVHIAEGYTRIARKPAVALGNPGPGGANMLAGLTSAYGEGHPVIAIACTRRGAVNNPDRGGAWQATDLVAMARPVTKYSELVIRPERVPEMVRAAFRAATNGRPGPAFLAIPDELLAARIDPDRLRVTPAANNRAVNLGAGDPALIGQAAELLASAQRPFIYAGKGVLWSGGSNELVALGDRLAAGMGSSLGARGVVPEDHPHYFHIFDMQASMTARNEADVVLVVRTRLGEYDGWGCRRPGATPAPEDHPDRRRPALHRAEPARRCGHCGGRARRWQACCGRRGEDARVRRCQIWPATASFPQSPCSEA
ncbi:MAG: thiamine pyrophosphate-binding protein [Caldilineales bacterium]